MATNCGLKQSKRLPWATFIIALQFSAPVLMLGLRSEFSYGIPHRIVSGCAQFGVLDDSGKAQLVVATTTNKIVIHDSETVLNINEKILALEVTRLGTAYDVIIVGTASSILAYDAFKNTNLFQRDMTDGVNCIQVGKFSTYDRLVFCGGNCAIWGLDVDGKDAFWTVTGDNVLSLCLSDVDNDGVNELIAGSEDYDIRVFKDDLLLYEMNETDAVIALHDLGEGRFAYALLNGTLGAYQGDTRLWRIKSKNQAVALALFPDSETLACAWIHGKVDMRESETGEVKLKESISGPIANVFVSTEQLVVVSTDGNVRGFVFDEGQSGVDDGQSLLHELGLKKHSLLTELRNYEQSQEGVVEGNDTNERKIPANTHLETCLAVNAQAKPPCVELQLIISSDAVIRAVILFAEGIFDGESYVVHPTENYTSSIAIQLRPLKDVAVDLHIKALIGYAQSTQLHVFEVTRAIPRFVMYALCTGDVPNPEGKAVFNSSERPPRLAAWINDNFLLADELLCEDELMLTVTFISLRTNEVLIIEMDGNGKVTIRNNDMELVGNIIQSMSESFRFVEISTVAEFPREIAQLNDLTEKLNEMYIMRDRLSAAMAERANSIKEMLVRAEDARIIKQLGLMRKYYLKLHTLNQAMMAEHKVRCNNHEQLLQLLRNLNKIIEKGARLREKPLSCQSELITSLSPADRHREPLSGDECSRLRHTATSQPWEVGAPASRVISACRNAIVEEHFDMLPKVILFGV